MTLRILRPKVTFRDVWQGSNIRTRVLSPFSLGQIWKLWVERWNLQYLNHLLCILYQIPKQATIEVPDEEKKVFVGGLPHDCKHEDVKEHFTRFGGVEKVKLMSDQVGTICRCAQFFVFVYLYSIQLISDQVISFCQMKRCGEMCCWNISYRHANLHSFVVPSFKDVEFQLRFSQTNIFAQSVLVR